MLSDMNPVPLSDERYGVDDGGWQMEGSHFMDTNVEEIDRDVILTRPDVPNVQVEHKAIGDEALVQTFYEGPEKCDCCINWVEKEPKEVPRHVKEKYNQAAI